MDAATTGTLAAWCREREGWTVTERDGGLSVTTGGAAGARTIEVTTGSDRVTLQVDVAVPSEAAAGAVPGFSLADGVAGIVEARPAVVEGGLEAAGTDQVIRLRASVHDDGLSKHTFSAALDELVRSSRILERFLEDVRGQREVYAELQLPAQPQPEPEPALGPFPVATTSQPVAQPTQPAVQPVQPAAPTPAPQAAAAWRRTHVAPAGGMAAWAAADPSRPPVAQLAPGTELRVVERLGDWGRVDASNGWTGWVDARLLVSAP